MASNKTNRVLKRRPRKLVEHGIIKKSKLKLMLIDSGQSMTSTLLKRFVQWSLELNTTKIIKTFSKTTPSWRSSRNVLTDSVKAKRSIRVFTLLTENMCPI